VQGVTVSYFLYDHFFEITFPITHA
jgi:hypothetical protein